MDAPWSSRVTASRSLSEASGILRGAGNADAIGHGAAFVGDVDGDGRADVALTGWSSGARPVHVVSGLAFAGADDPIGSVARATISAPATWIGGVVPAGDLDADGLGDVWIGAPYRLISGASTGAVDLAAATVVVDPGPTRARGAVAGDLDGDGTPDLAVGTDEAVLVFRGPFSAGVTGASAAALRVASSSNEAPTGTVAAGDLDGDGRGALGAATPCGAASDHAVTLGAVDGATTGVVALSDRGALQWWIECPTDQGAFEASVVGDVDGDGHADLGFAGEARAFIASGPLAGGVNRAAAGLSVVAQTAAGEYLAGAPESPGDVDGDGGADLAFATSVAGSPTVALLRSGRTGVIADRGWDEVFSATSLDAPRMVVRGGGDADGDGVGDLLVATPPTNDPSAVGHAWLLSGANLLP